MLKTEFRSQNAYQYRRSGATGWIISHVMRYPHFLVMAILGAILTNIGYSYRQMLIGQAFDVISKPGWELTVLGTLALSVAFVAVAEGLTGLLCYYSIHFTGQRVERDARDELYVSLLGKSQTFHSQQRIGDILSRATNDIRSLNTMFSPGLMLIMDAGMAIVMPIIFISFINLQLLLVPIIFVVLWVITVMHFSNSLNPVSWAQHCQFGVMDAELTESINGIELVKGYAQENHEKSKFIDNARKYRDYFIQQGKIQARYLPMLMFVLCMAAGFLHSLFLWKAGGISLGQVVSFVGLMGTFRVATSISTYSFTMVQMGKAGAERILEIINTETELDENPQGISEPIKGEVVFENVSFGYKENQVIKDITFSVKPGETIAIVGQTGSGKTTLTRLINRIFEAEEGRVLVDGKDVREWNMESLRSQISSIEQDVFLFSKTIAENIAFGCKNATREQVVKAAMEAQAHEFITSFADGYDTVIGDRGVTLSGGQRQRIAIARAFLTNPRILILDDSTSAIDSQTEEQIHKAMRRISSQRTTFIITHRLSQIRWANHIFVMRRGKLLDQGTHDELLLRSQEYKNIFSNLD
ncbi:MAG: transporter related [Eubacterium sp.]|nr:transporter related [Eubacterium sp.]